MRLRCFCTFVASISVNWNVLRLHMRSRGQTKTVHGCFSRITSPVFLLRLVCIYLEPQCRTRNLKKLLNIRKMVIDGSSTLLKLFLIFQCPLVRQQFNKMHLKVLIVECVFKILNNWPSSCTQFIKHSKSVAMCLPHLIYVPHQFLPCTF